MSTVTDLENQLENARQTVRKLRKAAKAPSGDFETDLATETQLASAERLLERLQRQLAESEAVEKRRQERSEREAAQARLSEIETIYRERCARLAETIDGAALSLEPVLETVLSERAELIVLNNEFAQLYQKLTGERVGVLKRPWRAGLVPGEFTPLPELSPLYDHTALALYAAVSEAEDLPYTLSLILAAVSGSTRPRSAENGPIPIPKSAEDETSTPMQKFVRQRRVNYD